MKRKHIGFNIGKNDKKIEEFMELQTNASNVLKFLVLQALHTHGSINLSSIIPSDPNSYFENKESNETETPGYLNSDTEQIIKVTKEKIKKEEIEEVDSEYSCYDDED